MSSNERKLGKLYRNTLSVDSRVDMRFEVHVRSTGGGMLVLPYSGSMLSGGGVRTLAR